MKICLVGASGKLGRVISDVAGASVVARVGSQSSPAEIQQSLRLSDVYIDVSSPKGTLAVARIARQTKTPAVVGTTGLDDSAQDAITLLADIAPVLQAANFSLGVAVLEMLVTKAAAQLADWDVEIVEAHHRHKRDAPSGTAKALAQAVAIGRQEPLLSREQPRRQNSSEIGMSSVRGGSVAGDHTVYFLGNGERVALGHVAENPTLFAAGALRAAAWVQAQVPGLYRMQDVLGDLS